MKNKERQIIVSKGKYGDQYFDARTPELELQAFLKMFKSNKDMEYYYPLQLSKDFDKEVKILESDIEKLKKLSDMKLEDLPREVAATVERSRKELPRKVDELEELKEDKLIYNAAVDGDGEAAKKLIKKRQDHEYEGFTYETLQ